MPFETLVGLWLGIEYILKKDLILVSIPKTICQCFDLNTTYVSVVTVGAVTVHNSNVIFIATRVVSWKVRRK